MPDKREITDKLIAGYADMLSLSVRVVAMQRRLHLVVQNILADSTLDQLQRQIDTVRELQRSYVEISMQEQLKNSSP